MHKLIHDSQIFNKLVNIKANLAYTYLDAETVRSKLRDTRKSNNQRDNHQTTFDSALKTLNDIHRNIHSNCKHDFYSSPLNYMTTSLPFLSHLQVLQDKPLSNLHEQIAQLETEKDICTMAINPESISKYANKICLIWTKKNEEETFTLLTKQIKEMQEYLSSQKKNIQLAYAGNLENGNVGILKTMCNYATEEINLMGKALAIRSSAFNEDFTRVYTVKNPVGKKFQEGCAIVRDAIWNSTPTYDTYNNKDNPFEILYRYNPEDVANDVSNKI